MKQIMQNFKTGVLSVEDVPVPKIQDNGLLVRNAFSLISAGTERSSPVKYYKTEDEKQTQIS